ncbi:hypothetical protein AQ490_11710 [Wenjunlia vitaminophila]|uniref:DUF1440 domain-containing protein n=1 Tax=Wenjunlia vitaminophila TaxID=76728 RepID=A0A0T6LL12_WENVI|nr:hypothetical protein [Wenjunlia vitaminophila]KRV46546.1 hypothetical protein AQ490_11710 [Wenjunlia vitaminophila]
MGRLGRLAADTGVGMAAGLVGTAAMTVSSTLEAKLRGRAGSNVPADAVVRLLRVRPVDERGRALLNHAAHFGYGTALGSVRGVLAARGMSPVAASAAHLALVWGAELVVLPALDLTPPATRWGAVEVAVDGWHHLVYAVATGAAYALLDRGR